MNMIETIDVATDEIDYDAALSVVDDSIAMLAPNVATDEEVENTVKSLSGTPDEIENDAIDAIAVKLEAYDSQENTGDVDTDAKGIVSAEPVSEPRKVARASGFSRSRTTIDALAANEFVLTTSQMSADHEEIKAAVMKLRDGLAKKIVEKFDNLFVAVSADRLPSCYTMVAYKALVEKAEITSADVYNAMKTAGYSEGTARAQGQQLMTLLPLIEIARKDGKKLTLNSDSVLAKRLDAIIAKSTGDEEEPITVDV